MRIRLYSKIIFFLWIAQVGVQSHPALAMTSSLLDDRRSKNQKISTLLRFSGIENSLETVESIVAISGDINDKALEPGQGEFAKRIMRKAYSSEKFIRALKQSFDKNYKPQHILSAVQWYRSSLGKKILRLEKEANNLESQPARELFVENLLNSPPSEERISLIEKIESSARWTESSKALYLGYVKLMYPFNRSIQSQRLGKMLRILSGSITEPLREIILRGLLFAYRDLKESELKAYSNFLNSNAGHWYKQTALTGLKKAIKKTLYQAESIREELLNEIDVGGPEFPLIREIAPPGQRYLLIGKRDPFKPLVDGDGLIDLSAENQDSKVRLFGEELKDIPPIALPVIAQIEDHHPKLFRSLKVFERLINNREEMEELSDEDYADFIDNYRETLEQAAETKMNLSPLQIEYTSLRMTGIIRKKLEAVAMFEISSTGYAVRQGDRIGPFFGDVEKIQEEQVIVVEKFRDYLGNTLTNQKIIEFYQGKSSEDNSNL